MGSKCWFVLKQTHYPPPVLFQEEKGQKSGKGPICLGHLIPDLRHLDNVINSHGPLDIPPEIPVYPSQALGLEWRITNSDRADASCEVGIPLPAAPGLSIQTNAGVAFKRTVNNYWEFTSLETSIFQPTREYIEDSVQGDQVTAYQDKRGIFKSPTMFMITGIMIARGARIRTSEVGQKNIHGGPGVGLAPIAEAGIDVNVSKETEISLAAEKVSDFVWAVRLAKISNGFFNRDWSHETFSNGATFSVGSSAEKDQHIVGILQSEGLQGIQSVDVTMSDNVFIVDTESEEMLSV